MREVVGALSVVSFVWSDGSVNTQHALGVGFSLGWMAATSTC
jgi:hypothetical protein